MDAIAKEICEVIAKRTQWSVAAIKESYDALKSFDGVIVAAHTATAMNSTLRAATEMVRGAVKAVEA